MTVVQSCDADTDSLLIADDNVETYIDVYFPAPSDTATFQLPTATIDSVIECGLLHEYIEVYKNNALLADDEIPSFISIDSDTKEVTYTKIVGEAEEGVYEIYVTYELEGDHNGVMETYEALLTLTYIYDVCAD